MQLQTSHHTQASSPCVWINMHSFLRMHPKPISRCIKFISSAQSFVVFYFNGFPETQLQNGKCSVRLETSNNCLEGKNHIFQVSFKTFLACLFDNISEQHCVRSTHYQKTKTGIMMTLVETSLYFFSSFALMSLALASQERALTSFLAAFEQGQGCRVVVVSHETENRRLFVKKVHERGIFG